jgi:hypothetical protein
MYSEQRDTDDRPAEIITRQCQVSTCVYNQRGTAGCRLIELHKFLGIVREWSLSSEGYPLRGNPNSDISNPREHLH